MKPQTNLKMRISVDSSQKQRFTEDEIALEIKAANINIENNLVIRASDGAVMGEILFDDTKELSIVNTPKDEEFMEFMKIAIIEAKDEAKDVQGHFDSLTESLIFDAVKKYKDHLESKVKYVWLNVNEGFSNSWTPEMHAETKQRDPDLFAENSDGYKLIRYECVNQKEFEFINLMKLK